jgi:hypothetical protein
VRTFPDPSVLKHCELPTHASPRLSAGEPNGGCVSTGTGADQVSGALAADAAAGTDTISNATADAAGRSPRRSKTYLL